MPGKTPKSNTPSSMQGDLLLSDPSLRDGVFDHSVILLTHHSTAEGAHGLILNHPTGKSVGDLLPDEEFGILRKLAVHFGGPVSADQLTFCSFWWTKNRKLKWSIRISKEEALAHAHHSGRIVRAFVGYAGWSAGQLEEELQRHSWHITPTHKDLLSYAHDDSLWQKLLSAISPFHHLLTTAPRDPFLN